MPEEIRNNFNQKKQIAGVVVLYNPDKNVTNNINSYLNQIERLYIVDNSDKQSTFVSDFFRANSKVEYIFNNGNLGIAAALNTGVKKATDEGFDFLLTMDQDSKAAPFMVADLYNCFSQDPQIAIVSPPHYPEKKRSQQAGCKRVFTVWTSGNLINLDIFRLTDGFREDLFIDYVDHEICLRLNKIGYKVYTSGKAALIHNLGQTEEKKFFFRKVYTTNHSPVRHYYRTRNRFYVNHIYKKLFPEFIKQDRKDFWKSFLKVILFEKQKLEKIKYFITGYLDYKKNKFGKLRENSHL